ncbi:MAG: YhbY family RNA-binding protein [Bacilli bacterium]|nr:YhbY family RNA-binding protein [Bacilli bacterium]
MLTPKERSHLKSLANHLGPSLIIGKGDITDNMIASIKQALEAHELIKIKLLVNALPPNDAAGIITHKTGADLVSIIGRVITIYKMNPKKNIIKLK